MDGNTLHFLAAIGLWAGVFGIAWALHRIFTGRRRK
jgi:hypothetical protein